MEVTLTEWPLMGEKTGPDGATELPDTPRSRHSLLARPGGPAYGLATELADTFEAIPVVTGGELIISRPVFTRLVLITAHAKSINANRHMMANRPVYLGLWRGAF